VKLIGTLLLVFIATVFPAQAANTSGQIPGVYVIEGSKVPTTPEEIEELQLKCVLAPGVIDDNGRGVGYFLDRTKYRATGTISYIKGQTYDCRYTPATRIENCASQEWSDGKSLSYYRTNVYETFTELVQRGHSLLTPEDVVAWNIRKTLNPAGAFAYHRCTCLTDSIIKSFASTDINALSGEETGKYLFWWKSNPSADDLDVARSVLKHLGGCVPKLS
jgi:hypothetical protein